MLVIIIESNFQSFQTYDGASNMQNAIKGMHTIIQKHNSNAQHL